MRPERRRDLIRVLQEGRASSQHEIAEALRAAGHDVTQATVSRDLAELGAVKVRSGSGFTYRLPDDVGGSTSDFVARNLMRTLNDLAYRVATSGSLVVVATEPGHAGMLARAIDLAKLDPVIGTIAGDDTIFVATTDVAAAAELAAVWSSQLQARAGEVQSG